MKTRGFLIIGTLFAGTLFLAMHHARVRAASAELRARLNVDRRARAYEVHVPAGYGGEWATARAKRA